MPVSDRRISKDRRTAHSGVPRDVATLNEDENPPQEFIVVGGRPVSVPASFGSDGEQHWLGMPSIGPGGKVSLFKH